MTEIVEGRIRQLLKSAESAPDPVSPGTVCEGDFCGVAIPISPASTSGRPSSRIHLATTSARCGARVVSSGSDLVPLAGIGTVEGDVDGGVAFRVGAEAGAGDLGGRTVLRLSNRLVGLWASGRAGCPQAGLRLLEVS